MHNNMLKIQPGVAIEKKLIAENSLVFRIAFTLMSIWRHELQKGVPVMDMANGIRLADCYDLLVIYCEIIKFVSNPIDRFG